MLLKIAKNYLIILVFFSIKMHKIIFLINIFRKRTSPYTKEAIL